MKTEVNERIFQEVSQFLYMESALLDDRDFRGWLDVLTKDIEYRVPLRVTKDEGQGPGFLENMAIMDDSYKTLEARIRRLETEYSWAEIPPSRTRHYVTNIRIEQGIDENSFQVKSNLLLYRSRGDSPLFDLLAGERHDVLRLEDGKWKLAKRIVYLDQTTLSAHNVSFFF